MFTQKDMNTVSITYYTYEERELPKAGVQPGDLVIYTGTVRNNQTDGPTSNVCTSVAYAYRWMDNQAQAIDIDFSTGDAGSRVLDITSGAEHYVFLLNKARTFLRQISGAKKPIVVGNIGADTIRVDTHLGKYTVPAGTMLRLDKNVPQRSNRINRVLLTLNNERGNDLPIESAQLLTDNGYWRPLNICGRGSSIQVKDGPFVVQTLSCDVGYDSVYKREFSLVRLNDPPSDPDYRIYFRCMCGELKVCFFSPVMKHEG